MAAQLAQSARPFRFGWFAVLAAFATAVAPQTLHAQTLLAEPAIEEFVHPADAIWADGSFPQRTMADRLWVRSDLLLWWTSAIATPPLVTTSPTGTAVGLAGQLDQSSTSVLVGGSQRLDDSMRIGGRGTIGYWFDATWGIEATYFGLRSDWSARLESPILARPFSNVEPGLEGPDAELVAYPNLLTGAATVATDTTWHNVEVLLRRATYYDRDVRIDLLAGWRLLRMDDELRVTDFKQVLSGNLGLAIGTVLSEVDTFHTVNRFNGGELGVSGEVHRRRWTLNITMKLAVGSTQAKSRIGGQTTVVTPVAGGGSRVDVTGAGLLAQQTNSGVQTTNRFALVPELGVTLAYDVTARLQATVGYSLLYWRAARPGALIDPNLNLSQLTPLGLVGPPNPAFRWNFNDFWAQGLNLGLQYQF